MTPRQKKRLVTIQERRRPDVNLRGRTNPQAQEYEDLTAELKELES